MNQTRSEAQKMYHEAMQMMHALLSVRCADHERNQLVSQIGSQKVHLSRWGHLVRIDDTKVNSDIYHKPLESIHSLLKDLEPIRIIQPTQILEDDKWAENYGLRMNLTKFTYKNDHHRGEVALEVTWEDLDKKKLKSRIQFIGEHIFNLYQLGNIDKEMDRKLQMAEVETLKDRELILLGEIAKDDDTNSQMKDVIEQELQKRGRPSAHIYDGNRIRVDGINSRSRMGDTLGPDAKPSGSKHRYKKNNVVITGGGSSDMGDHCQ